MINPLSAYAFAISNILLKCGVPSKFVLNGFHHNERVADFKGKSIFLTGATGTGKTTFLASLMRQRAMDIFPATRATNVPIFNIFEGIAEIEDIMVRYNSTMIFANTPDLLTELKQCYNSKSKSEAEILSKYTTPNMLLLDDIGPEKSTDWVHEKLYQIINSRYTKPRSITVVSSNLDLQQLADRGDDRIASRLAEMCISLRLSGHNYRLDKNID